MIRTSDFEATCEHGYVWGFGCPVCDQPESEEDERRRWLAVKNKPEKGE